MKQASDVQRSPSPTLLLHAEVSLLPTENGGRRMPIHSGYRASFTLPKHGVGDRVDGQLLFSPADEIKPGQVALVDIQPLVPEHWSSVGAGSDLALWEGRRQIGVAHVR